jgi:dihydrofolate reductase
MDLRIEGFAIVSRDGMLAGADGLMPNSLKFDGDQEFLDKSLDAAALLVHGRMSHEGQPNSCNRRRLLLTRRAGPFSREPLEPNVWLWNPEATPFADVCAALGLESGVVAVLGGTAVYDLFLPLYARFHICRAGKVALPGGVPVFSAVREGRAPDEILREAGLVEVDEFTRDASHDLRHHTWARARPGRALSSLRSP